MFDMISNIFRNLSSKPATRRYPFEKREPFKDTRGKVGGMDIDACIFCGICNKKCPSDAIKVNKVDKSWEIDPFKCIVCSVCVDACPKKCIYMSEDYNAVSTSKEKLKYVQKPKPVEQVQDSEQNQ